MYCILIISSFNLLASKSYAAAVADIKKFFSEGLCCNTNIDLTADDIPCPGVDRRLSANGRVAQEQIIIDSGELIVIFLSISL